MQKVTLSEFNPSHPNISTHILHTIYYSFLKVLTRRICLIIYPFPTQECHMAQDAITCLIFIHFFWNFHNHFFSWWSFSCDLHVWFREDITRRNQMLVTLKGERVKPRSFHLESSALTHKQHVLHFLFLRG